MELFLATLHTQKASNQELFKLFTSHKNYLTTLSIDHQEYIGKQIPPTLSFEALMDQKAHVASLLKRLFPESTFSSDDFVLIPKISSF